MYFEIIGSITDIETIAVGRSIRALSRLRKRYGRGRWRKLKGVAALPAGNFGELRFTGTKLTASGVCVTRSRGSWIEHDSAGEEVRDLRPEPRG